MSFFVGKFPPTILKATWYLNENHLSSLDKTKPELYTPFSKYILGVLYSDNVIRFFLFLKILIKKLNLFYYFFNNSNFLGFMMSIKILSEQLFLLILKNFYILINFTRFTKHQMMVIQNYLIQNLVLV